MSGGTFHRARTGGGPARPGPLVTELRRWPWLPAASERLDSERLLHTFRAESSGIRPPHRGWACYLGLALLEPGLLFFGQGMEHDWSHSATGCGITVEPAHNFIGPDRGRLRLDRAAAVNPRAGPGSSGRAERLLSASELAGRRWPKGPSESDAALLASWPVSC